MRIDAHQHFWSLARGDYNWLTPDFTAIYRDFLPKELRVILDTHAIDGTILVQAADSDAETDYMLSLADEHEWIFGVVGWVDMDSPDASKRLRHLARNPKFVGIRPMIQDIPDDNWMLRPSLRSAFETLMDLGLKFDALLMPRHLDPFMKFLKLYPNLNIIIDHCAKPKIRNNAFQTWADQIANIASISNCFCKLSGLITEANKDWIDDDIKPYAAHILDCFGPDRVVFGSDWPVLKLAGEYSNWIDFVAQLSEPQTHANLFGNNAARFYLESHA